MRASRLFPLAVVAATLAACNGVLGIEDAHVDEAFHPGESGGAPSGGGASAGTGGEVSGGSGQGGEIATGGASGEGGEAGAGQGGTAGETSTGGSAGEAGGGAGGAAAGMAGAPGGAGTGGSPGTCAHDVCSTGPALDATCSACATTVCSADPACCTNAWDGSCVTAAQASCTECGATGGMGGAAGAGGGPAGMGGMAPGGAGQGGAGQGGATACPSMGGVVGPSKSGTTVIDVNVWYCGSGSGGSTLYLMLHEGIPSTMTMPISVKQVSNPALPTEVHVLFDKNDMASASLNAGSDYWVDGYLDFGNDNPPGPGKMPGTDDPRTMPVTIQPLMSMGATIDVVLSLM